MFGAFVIPIATNDAVTKSVDISSLFVTFSFHSYSSVLNVLGANS